MAGKKILTQFALPVGSTSGSFGSGSAGQVLTSGGDSASMYWGAAGSTGKFSATITWGTNATNISFTGNTCFITHGLNTEALVVSVKDINGSSDYTTNNMHMDIGNDAYVTIPSSSIVELELSVSGGNPSSGDQFLVTIIG